MVSATILTLIIAIVVPLAVLLPKRGRARLQAAVILPLYIYPATNASWAPLFSSYVEQVRQLVGQEKLTRTRLSARPDLNFTIIINPNSGPGSSQYPDQFYAAALDRLANYTNVEKLGYVRTGYASRNLSDVISEVDIYAGWVSKNQAFAMDGVFFDEAPHNFTQKAVDFMLSASLAVKDAQGFQRSKVVCSGYSGPTANYVVNSMVQVIRNPGVVPDNRFADPNTDINVVFEQSYDEYELKEPELSAMNHDRLHRCYMVHSLPTLDRGKMRGFVNSLSRGAGHLFVTHNAEHYYEQFAGDWSDFISAIAK